MKRKPLENESQPLPAVDIMALDFGGKLDNCHEDSAFAISPEIFARKDFAADFEGLCDGVES